jgi:hypothetical protein
MLFKIILQWYGDILIFKRKKSGTPDAIFKFIYLNVIQSLFANEGCVEQNKKHHGAPETM